ncbi:glucose sorbosone dehydrogenase [Aeromicrobium sp. PE09-221]|nr:glucose sorbosone dehydrogenase [Aeromicrobium sp. PE09-221]
MRIFGVVTASSLVVALAACSAGEDATPDSTPSPAPTTTGEAPTTVPPSVDTEIAGDVNVPWGMVFDEDGTAFVAQRDDASILAVEPDGTVTDLGAVEGVEPGGEGGLLGLALSPDGSRLYAYLTSAEDNRVVQMTVEGDTLGSVEPVLTGIAKANNHNGGALAYDADDDVLFVATGDALDPETAQDSSTLEGKILRITPDGTPAPGNPFDNEVWSLGHRNVQGLAFDADGRLWSSEFGDKGADELNLIEAGGNYGWPVVEGQSDDERFVAPKVTWPTDEASPSGLAIIGDTAYLGALRGERLWSVPLDGEQAGEPEGYLVQEYGRIRAVAAAPDGSLWIGTSNTDGRSEPAADDDRLLRLTVTQR